jgi:hypothetical protein
MDALDLRRLDHAEQTIEKGRATVEGDFKNGFYWIWSGHMLKVTTQLKNGDPGATPTIQSLKVDSLKHLAQRPIRVGAQNDLVLLLLAIRDVEGAREIAGLERESNDAAQFDVALNVKLLAALSRRPVQISYKPTDSEAGVLNDLDLLAIEKATDLTGTDSFWKALRRKRFANTMYEHRNIFNDALSSLQRI